MLISGVQQTDLVLFLIQSTSQKLNNKYFCLVTTLISKKPPISPYPGVDSVQLLGCVQLCDPIDCNRPASLSITNSQSLLRLMFIDCHPPMTHGLSTKGRCGWTASHLSKVLLDQCPGNNYSTISGRWLG